MRPECLELQRLSIMARRSALAALLFAAAPVMAEPPTPPAAAGATEPAVSEMTMETFLDRLMLAESGGRDTVANPRSTAVGPFQFVVATFLSVARRHFAAETAALTPQQILALRTNRAFARRAAEAFTRDNAAQLAAAGIATSWPNLRLAFFAGADGAIRVIKARPETPAAAVLGAAATAANPFLLRLTAAGLIERSARDLQQPATTTAGLAVTPGLTPAATPRERAVPVQCDLSLPSCRRWLALAERRQLRKIAAAAARATRLSAKP